MCEGAHVEVDERYEIRRLKRRHAHSQWNEITVVSERPHVEANQCDEIGRLGDKTKHVTAL